MQKEIIAPDGIVSNGVTAPAVRWGNIVYTSGITPVNADADTATQVRSVLDQVAAILATVGSDLSYVIKVNCWLAAFREDFGTWNAIFKEYFPTNPPARMTVPWDVSHPTLKVEVEIVAGVP